MTVSTPGLPGGIYISPTGSDAQAGTLAQPWGTFASAILRLGPGDTLVLLDGLYGPTNTGLPNVDCILGAQNGTASERIQLVALNERKAFIRSSGLQAGVTLRGCSYWTVHGLRIENGDNEATTSSQQGASILVRDSSFIEVRRILAGHNNRFENSDVISFQNSFDSLVEECEVYDFHREGISLWRSARVTLRRNYINSRGYSDVLINDALYPTGIATQNGYVSGLTDRGDASYKIDSGADPLSRRQMEDIPAG